MEKIAVYPGTFDPITNGHKSIVERASTIFDAVIVAIVEKPEKQETFSIAERCAMASETFSAMQNVNVEPFSGLLVHYVQHKKSSVVIRGLRALADFEYEFQLALANRELCPTIETLFFMTDHKYLFVSSSLVKSIAKYGGDISSLVPSHVSQKVLQYFIAKE